MTAVERPTLEYDRRVRRNGTARLVLALIVSYGIYDLSFSRAMEVSHNALGEWGLIAAVVVIGFGLSLVFSAIYDGPVALRQMFRRHDDGAPADGTETLDRTALFP
jgi:hypothetical protein